MPGPRVLTIDIETSPIRSLHWKIFDETIGIEQIEEDWSILSYCAKWLDDKELIYEDTGGRGLKRVRDDKPLMKGLHGLLSSADIVVGQNIRRFDIKKINARLAIHGYDPPSPFRTIDTMCAAKDIFGLTSYKLAWLSHCFTETKKSEHKKFPGFELWRECLKDNPEAWAEMRAYNALDVLATEEVYLKLRPWMKGHPNFAAYSFGDGVKCPRCESTKLQHRGRETTQHGSYARIKCMSCGGWSRLKQNLIGKEDRARLLVN